MHAINFNFIANNVRLQKLNFVGLMMRFSYFLNQLVNQCRYQREYEGINWESVRSKYERIQEVFTDSYLKTSVEGKEFPALENPEVISKDRVAAKL